MNKNNLLIIAAIVLMAAIGCEVAIYLGYDLYHSENGIFLRHKVYIPTTYENMSESELRQRVETGDADAMAMLSSIIQITHKETECKEALELAQKSADMNCPRGKVILGYFYGIGYCVPQNPKKAFDLYKEASDENEPIAQYDIGICNLNGFAVKKDTTEALKYIEKSAIQGFPLAQYKLAFLYYYGGNTIKRDVSKGIEWLTLASDQGMPIAQYELSMIYYNGESGEISPDYNKAKELCRKAAEQGQPEAKWAMENKFNSKDK